MRDELRGAKCPLAIYVRAHASLTDSARMPPHHTQFLYHTPEYRETKNFGSSFLFARPPGHLNKGLTRGVPVVTGEEEEPRVPPL